MGWHFLLQCMKVKSESEVTQLCLTLSDPNTCLLFKQNNMCLPSVLPVPGGERVSLSILPVPGGERVSLSILPIPGGERVSLSILPVPGGDCVPLPPPHPRG